MVRLHNGLRRFLVLSALAGQSVVGAVHAAPANAGWDLEKDVETPSYAVAEPASTDVNVDSVVLSCEQGPDRAGLQLRLYLTDAGPLTPQGAGTLRADPAFEFAIDGVRHAAHLIFADEFIVVADSADGALPLLSESLVRALQYGRRMELRFGLAQDVSGQAPAFDGSVVVDLQAGRGGSAVATVRRCTGVTGQQVAETAGRMR